MKQRESFGIIAVLVALTVLTVLGGCPMTSGGGGPSTIDNAESGIMSRVTAERIFKLGTAPDGGIQIENVKSVLELAAYLNRSESRASITIELGDVDSFTIPPIVGGVPVTAIGNGAFAPQPKAGTSVLDLNTDITTILNKVVLPDTVKTLGTHLFDGATEPIKVVIPPVVIQVVTANASSEAGQTALKEVIGEPHKPVAIFDDEKKADDADVENLSDMTEAVGVVTETEVAEKDGRTALIAGASAEPTTAELTADVTFTGADSLTLTADHFTVDGGATIESAANSSGTVTVTVTLGSNDSTANKIYTVGINATSMLIKGTAAVTITQKPAVEPIETLAALPEAIGRAKAVANGKGVVLLTPEFYNAANSAATALVIDAGTTDNTSPYTIRGVGKNGTSLTVGVLLANDNVTLEDVKIAVSGAGSILSAWSVGSYRSALFIGRAKTEASTTALLTVADAASKHVTVRNCDITATGFTNTYTAGIYVWGERKANASPALYPSTDITIDGNTILATGYDNYSVQGINIRVWDPTVVITNNTITSRYGSRAAIPFFDDTPASAIFVNRVYNAITPNAATNPTISGNTLASDAYTFYFNACEDTNVADAASTTGIASFRTRKFANADTTWATASTDNTVYRKLFDALKANVTGKGSAFVATYPTLNAFNGGFAIEQYEITDGQLVAISVLGGIISDGTYTYNTSGTVNRFVSSGDGPKGYDYGRKLVNAPNESAAWTNVEQNKFCYGLDGAGGYYYETDLDMNTEAKSLSPSGTP